MKFPNFSDLEHIEAYKHALRFLPLMKMLATKTLQTVDNLLDMVHKFIKGEIRVQST